MDRTALLVVFLAALTCVTDATLTWEEPVNVANGKATLARNILAGALTFDPELKLTATSDVSGATVTYTLTNVVPQQAPFAIDTTTTAGTCTITISQALDYATVAIYTLDIEATEVPTGGGGANNLKSTATVTVTVDYPAPFSKSEDSVCVPDGSKADTVVRILPNATSDDTYQITGDTTNTFDVAANKIVVLKPLNKTVTPSFTLTIKATGKPDELELKVQVGNCSAASLLAPLGLLTLLMALLATTGN